jgi:hypothetical protein
VTNRYALKRTGHATTTKKLSELRGSAHLYGTRGENNRGGWINETSVHVHPLWRGDVSSDNNTSEITLRTNDARVTRERELSPTFEELKYIGMPELNNVETFHRELTHKLLTYHATEGARRVEIIDVHEGRNADRTGCGTSIVPIDLSREEGGFEPTRPVVIIVLVRNRPIRRHVVVARATSSGADD